MEYLDYYQSPIGRMTLGSDGESLIGLWFDQGRFFCSTISGETQEKNLPVFARTKRWLDIYFGGGIPDFTPPLLTADSDFRNRVWEILKGIPYGQTITYGEIAEIVAKERGISKMASQAVGGAVGHNPISIIIPCHRVVGKNGSLVGYGAGLDRKRALLTLEKAF